MAESHTRRNAGKAPTNDSNTPVPILVVSCILTPVPAQALTFTSAPAFIPGLPGRYTDENLQKATKLALKSFVKGQEHG